MDDDDDFFEDGWGDDDDDDDDLDLLDDSASEPPLPAKSSPAVVPTPLPVAAAETSAAPPAAGVATASDGWDDDNDLEFSEHTEPRGNINVDTITTTKDPALVVAGIAAAAASTADDEDGWKDVDGGGNNLMDLSDSTDDEPVEPVSPLKQFDQRHRTALAASSSMVDPLLVQQQDNSLDYSETQPAVEKSLSASSYSSNNPQQQEQQRGETGGFDDDFDFSDNLDDDDPIAVATASNPPPPTKEDTEQEKVEDGWDDEGWGDDEIEDEAITAPSTEPVLPKATAQQKDEVPPVKKILSPETQNLCHVLADYILTLPRHTQSVAAVLQAEYNTMDKAMELQQYYGDRPHLVDYTVQKELPRMDYILTDHAGSDVITDKDRVRNAMEQSNGAICVRCANQSLLADLIQVLTGSDRVVRPQHLATAVAAQCRFRVDVLHNFTEVVAVLDLSLPTSQGRWKIAEICSMILFKCDVPMVEFRLPDIRVTATPEDTDWNQRIEECAEVLSSLQEMEKPVAVLSEQQNFRDVFLQTRLQETAAEYAKGMRSAWNDIDAATGFGNKLRQMPAFLPDSDILEAAALEQEKASKMESQQPKNRPTSILGGFVRSLAQTVTLPDEEALQVEAVQKTPDTAFPLLDNQGQPPSEPSIPKLYNKDTPKHQSEHPDGAFPHLYNIETPEPPAQNTEQIPHLYNKETPRQPPSHPTAQAFPHLYNKETPKPAPPQQPMQQGIPRLYNNKTPEVAAQKQHHSGQGFPRLYSKDTPKPTPQEQVEKDITRLYHNEPPEATADTFPRLYSTEPQPVPAGNSASVPMHAIGKQSSDTVEDGWADDDVGDVDVDDDDVMKSPEENSLDLPTANFVYDPVTDIIPTRKRWINPRPGPRDLRSMMLTAT